MKISDRRKFPTPETKLEIKMIELVNLQECLNYVVKVVRRDDRTLYGKIIMHHKYPDDDRHFLFDLGNGGGVRYNKCGRVTGKTANGLEYDYEPYEDGAYYLYKFREETDKEYEKRMKLLEKKKADKAKAKERKLKQLKKELANLTEDELKQLGVK